MSRVDTAAGVAKQLELKGNYQSNAYEQNVERHPAVEELGLKPSIYARHTSFHEPEGTISTVAGSTLRFCVGRCNGYLTGVSMVGKVTATTTTQANANTTDNTAFYKDDAWFMILEEVRMEFGCESVHVKEEDGQLWVWKYNHFFNGDQRLGVLVNDGSPVQRADWARGTQHFRVPFLFDNFSHESKALRIWTMADSPVRFKVKLRPMSYVTEYTGTAIDAAGVVQAGFAPGELQDVRLAYEFIQIPVKDAKRLERAAPERVTYIREWCRYRDIPHASTTATQTIDLPITNTMESLLIFPKLNDVHVLADVLLASPAAELPLFIRNTYPFCFRGALVADGTGVTISNPFAGAELQLDGSARVSFTYEEMTEWTNTFVMARNTTDKNEAVAGFHFGDPMSPVQQPGIQTTKIQHKKLYIYWTYDGRTAVNWDGVIDVYISTMNVLVTDGHRIRKIYPS